MNKFNKTSLLMCDRKGHLFTSRQMRRRFRTHGSLIDRAHVHANFNQSKRMNKDIEAHMDSVVKGTSEVVVDLINSSRRTLRQEFQLEKEKHIEEIKDNTKWRKREFWSNVVFIVIIIMFLAFDVHGLMSKLDANDESGVKSDQMSAAIVTRNYEKLKSSCAESLVELGLKRNYYAKKGVTLGTRLRG